MRGASRADRRSQAVPALRRRESIAHLKQALAEERLVVHYQPIVDAATAEPVAAEGLLRWRRPEAESDELSVLLAAAEASPVIFALERWAIRTCCRDAARWPEQEPPLRLNVNLSAREFDRPRLGNRIRSFVRQEGLDPRRITLEITETSAISDPDAASRVLDEMRQHGFEVWLDDFGTGHSSLEWLWALPADGVKIPGTFAADVVRDERAAMITSAIVDLAHRLGLRVVAEGVETSEQRDWLVAAGCDQLQGFLFGPAQATRALPERAEEGAVSHVPSRRR